MGLLSRRSALALLAATLAPRISRGQDTRFFRIGTGSVSGTYYPVGALIADIISNPPGARPCDRGGDCGVPGLVAVAQTSEGSVDNIEAMQAGDIESGFAQSDAAYAAANASGVFAGRPPFDRIRALANLYPESLHLVARAGSGIAQVADLVGMRVSIDREGSGTRSDALLVLDAFGIPEATVKVEGLAPSEAVESIRDGALDALFLVAGAPTSAISELAADGLVRLIPISGEPASELVRRFPFFSYDLIPWGAYPGQPAIETLSVGAQWLASADIEPNLIYAILQSFWRPEAREILDSGHPKGREITLETALDGIAVPLHPGAATYYREVGLLR
jgi:TRAP transporter TAXI family solute receptor